MQPRALVVALALVTTALGARPAHAEDTKKPAPARAQKSEGTDKGKAEKADKPAEAAPAESAPKGAPAATPTPTARETTSKSGEKTYEFGAVEVEGRLKAPQILYFVRRVRAELRSGQLGHRSFLPELRDTRRSEALR